MQRNMQPKEKCKFNGNLQKIKLKVMNLIHNQYSWHKTLLTWISAVKKKLVTIKPLAQVLMQITYLYYYRIQWILSNETLKVSPQNTFCNLPGMVFTKSCLFSLLWKTTHLLRLHNWLLCTGITTSVTNTLELCLFSWTISITYIKC